jgi:hypothetical protein
MSIMEIMPAATAVAIEELPFVLKLGYASSMTSVIYGY